MTLFDSAGQPNPDVLPDRNRLGSFRKSDPPTPRLAALRSYNKVGKQRRKVLKVFVEAGDSGLTDYQAGERCGILRTSAGKRRLELGELHLIEKTDPVEHRPTDTGSPAIVWRVTEAGKRSWLLVAGIDE